MELKEFIKQSLIDICGGISEAREATGCVQGDGCKLYVISPDYLGEHNNKIRFDIAVSVSERTSAKGSADMGVGGSSLLQVVGLKAGVGGEVEKGSASDSSNRISFEILFCPQYLDRATKAQNVLR
jgi:hypothetical protein